MNRYAIIDEKTNLVVNVIIYDGGEWKPPIGTFMVGDDRANIGDLYDKDKKIFTPCTT